MRSLLLTLALIGLSAYRADACTVRYDIMLGRLVCSSTAGTVDYGDITNTPILRYQQVLLNSVAQSARTKLNIIAGTNVTVSGVDNAGADSTEVTISAAGGAQPVSQSTFCNSASVTDAYTCGVTPALTTYGTSPTFACITLMAATPNTGAATIDIDGLGVKAILSRSGDPLVTGDILAGIPLSMCYNGVSFYVDADGRGTNSTNILFTTPNYCRSTTGTDSYTCNLSPLPLSSYTAGACLILSADTHNTGAATLTVDGLATQQIRGTSNGNLKTNDIRADVPITVCYNGTNYYLQYVGEGTSASIGAKASWALCLSVPCTVGTDVANWYLVNVASAFGSCAVASKTAPVGAALSFDILQNGTTSIYGASTKPTLATGVTGPSVFPIASPLILAAGDYLTVSITSAGSSVPGLDVSLVCTGS